MKLTFGSCRQASSTAVTVAGDLAHRVSAETGRLPPWPLMSMRSTRSRRWRIGGHLCLTPAGLLRPEWVRQTTAPFGADQVMAIFGPFSGNSMVHLV